MSIPPVVVVVAGASGTLGKLLCEALIARGALDGRAVIVRGLVRRKAGVPDRGASAAAPGIQILPVDYDRPEELLMACEGASAVVSTLQGLEEVILGVQTRLLDAAIANGVRRFIPSDFSGDFTQLPEGSHRNFDLRRRFHQEAAARILAAGSPIEFTSIFQGGFTELLASGWVLFDYKARRINYFGSPDGVMEYTTWRNTAEFTAAVALDAAPAPRALYIAGQRLTPRSAQTLARQVTGVEFPIRRMMPTWLLGVVISLLRFFAPGKKGDVMPMWVGMQYGYCGALGVMSPERLDNDRYAGIVWTPANDVIREAFKASSQPVSA